MAISSREAGWAEVSAPAPPAARPGEDAAKLRAKAPEKTEKAVFMGFRA